MQSFDIIYIALICVIVAVVLWAYWKDILHNLNMNSVIILGGNRKHRKRKGQFKKYPKMSPF